jgi:hypothetical protein
VKLAIGSLLIFGMILPSPAGQSPLVGQTFKVGDVPIEWKVTSERKALWIYKVIPQSGFSMAVVSNAMAVGSFKATDVVRDDKSLIRFQDRKQQETRYLEIKPATGSIEYYDSTGTSDMTGPLVGVPSASEAERLGLELLFRLGIDRSQLASEPRNSGEMKRSKISPTKGEHDTEVMARHVVFVRQADGIPFMGNGLSGGLWIEFGNKAKITQFQLCWGNLIPHELCCVPPAAKMMQFLKEGRSVYAIETKALAAKKLTVTALTPYYLGQFSQEPQELVYPIARLGVEAETGERKVKFDVFCPLVEGAATGDPQRSRTNSEALRHVDQPVR